MMGNGRRNIQKQRFQLRTATLGMICFRRSLKVYKQEHFLKFYCFTVPTKLNKIYLINIYVMIGQSSNTFNSEKI